MKDIENYLPLFTNVTEGLPELNSNKISTMVLSVTNSRFAYLYRTDCGWCNEDGMYLLDSVTHWLDLSKLTTKEKAILFGNEIQAHLRQMSEPWSTPYVLNELINACEILLHKHDYDGMRHEEIRMAIDRGKEIIKLMRSNDFLEEKQKEL